MNEILRFEGINKKFETTGQIILKDISFNLMKGSFVVISGKSGSGKTTLLSIIAGIEEATSGKIFFENIEITGLNNKKRSERRYHDFAMITQNYNLIDGFTIMDNIILPFLIKNKKVHENKVDKIIKELELEMRVAHYPNELSGGQKQRVAIARAVLKESKVILADEITGNLNSEQSKNVIDLLLKLNKEKGTTIILITHDLSLITEDMIHLSLANGALITYNKVYENP